MRRIPLARTIAVLGVAAAASFLQCGEGESRSDSGCDEGPFPHSSTIYPDERRASDEALDRVWSDRCRATVEAGRSYALASPAHDEVVSPDEPVEFRWERAALAASIVPAGADAIAPAASSPMRALAAWGSGSTSSSGRGLLYLGIATASAHMPPVTGEVYLVEFRPLGAGPPLYVFTADESWIPDAEAWETLRAMGKVDVMIWTAYLEDNVIFAGDGPFISPAASRFTIGTP